MVFCNMTIHNDRNNLVKGKRFSIGKLYYNLYNVYWVKLLLFYYCSSVQICSVDQKVFEKTMWDRMWGTLMSSESKVEQSKVTFLLKEWKIRKINVVSMN